jgi:hypothetical protein
MNSLFVIAPYKYHGMWVFDDPRVGLEAEPFVAGADTIIDRLVRNIPDPDKGFVIVFSGGPFPGCTHRLDWVREEMSGNVYRLAELDMEGWLCPALFKYFDDAPREIFLKVEPRAGA